MKTHSAADSAFEVVVFDFGGTLAEANASRRLAPLRQAMQPGWPPGRLFRCTAKTAAPF